MRAALLRPAAGIPILRERQGGDERPTQHCGRAHRITWSQRIPRVRAARADQNPDPESCSAGGEREREKVYWASLALCAYKDSQSVSQ